MTSNLDPKREIQNLDGESLGMSIADYDSSRPQRALDKVHTLCHAPFTVMDLGPQGQVTTCNHFHRFIGNLNTDSWLDIFRGEDWTHLRQNMLDYKISEMDCRHCSRQIRSGHGKNAFAQEHFDPYPAETANPKYPTVIIFRLSNVCNLMCVMCNGTLSHRIRKEREGLPPLPPPPYDEKFFQEMEETLPHVKYIEFYGGEPFLVKEHLRILDIIEKTGAKTEIYVNTNSTAITPKIKGYIERLNFIKIAASVDAIYADIHERQRIGIKHDVCLENVEWFLELRKTKPKLWVGLNTTETRFNWYHLPVMYEWAAERDVYIHINTCLHPSDTTIYDLPTEEIAYIGDFYARWRQTLGKKLDVKGNERSYGHLEAMVNDELTARRDGTKRPNPYPTDRDPIHGGLMWVPELKRRPIDTPKAAKVEIKAVQEHGCWEFALRMANDWLEAIEGDTDAWAKLRPELEALAAKAAPLAEEFAQRRSADDERRTIRAAWKLEQQGKLTAVLATLSNVAKDSDHFAEAELLRARTHRRLGDYEVGKQALDSAFALAPTDPAVFIELAWFAFDTNDIETGLSHARRARSLTAADAERSQQAAWAHALGALAVRAGDKAEATEALRSLEQAAPNTGPTKELREAVENFDEVRNRLAIDSAWRLERSGQFEDALAAIDGISLEAPLGYEAAIPRARALRRSGEVDAAKATLEAASAQHSDRPEAWVEFAWLCYDEGSLDAGIEHALRASAMPGNTVAWAHALAVLAVAAGRADDAVAALAKLHAERALETDRVNPAGEAAHTAEREAIARAWQHEGKGEYAECEALIEQIPNSSPNRKEALVIRARAQRRRGDVGAALRTMALSLAIEPVQMDALIELAWAGLDGDSATGLKYARCARRLSEQHNDPIGIVGWAHPLGLLALECDTMDLVTEVLARLDAANDPSAAAVRKDISERLEQRRPQPES